MKNQSLSLLAAPLLVLAACGDNQEVPDANRNRPPDARPIDGPTTIDSMPGSTVTVTAGDCPGGTADFELRVVAGPVFEEAGGGPDNPTITLAVGDTIHFQTTAGMHNFMSAAGTPAEFQFRSGNPGPHEACLTFTAATPAVTYRCEVHAAMTGTVDVN